MTMAVGCTAKGRETALMDIPEGKHGQACTEVAELFGAITAILGKGGT
jgi:hypothetical protein